jgi:hypothetical protein
LRETYREMYEDKKRKGGTRERKSEIFDSDNKKSKELVVIYV